MKITGREGIQQTEEWRSLRKSCVTSTDIPIIMGYSPFCDKRTLWRRKMDLEPEQPVNAAMRRGSELEEEARQLFCKITCSCLEPEVHRHSEYSWAISSVDGIDLDGDEVLEVKCPTRTPTDDVPEYHWMQCQWHLACTGANICHYVVYFNNDIRSWKIERDEEFIKKALQSGFEFKDSMTNFVEPETDKSVLAEITCPESLYRLDRYNELCQKIDEMEKKRSDLRENIIQDAKGQACKGGGFKVIPVEREGNVDYSKIPELKGVSLENYRKSKTVYWTIKKDKQ